MFDHDPELSPDLVWLLQSQQVEDGLLTRMLVDAKLPSRLRPLVVSAVAYFNLQGDVLPEDLEGPRGYLDDVFYCAFIVNEVRQEMGSDQILTDNWSGDVPILPLVRRILSQEKELIGDKRDLVLWYIGYEHLLAGNK